MARDTDEIRAEIRDTRERMSETLDELGTRLNPNRIKAHVKENIREATVGRVENMARQAQERVNATRDGLLDTIRDNPIPAAMIGIGIGWMLFNGRRRHSDSYHGSHDTHLHGDAGYIGDVSATTPRLIQDDAAGGIGASISHDHNGVVDKVRNRIASVGDGASSLVGTAQERVSDVAHRLTHVTSDVADTTRYHASRVEERVSRTLQDSPLALGAVALAAGLAAGLAIPETEREQELLGPARDKLMNRARTAVDDVRERVQTAAERVIDDTRDSVSEAVSDLKS